MSSQTPDPSPRKGSSLWARMFAVQQEDENEPLAVPEATADPTPQPDEEPAPPSPASEIPLAQRVVPPPEPVFTGEAIAGTPQEVGGPSTDEESEAVAQVVDQALGNDVGPTPAEAALIAVVGETLELTAPPAPPAPSVIAEAVAEPVPAEVLEPGQEPPSVPVPPQVCPACATPRQEGSQYCGDCGYMFGAHLTPTFAAVSPGTSTAAGLSADGVTGLDLKNRFHVSALLDERLGVKRYRALDLGDGSSDPRPVILVSTPLPVVAEVEAAAVEDEDEIIPTFDEPPVAVAAATINWPGASWEQSILQEAQTPFLPQVIDYFVEGNSEYLALEIPLGKSLWDAWLDAEDARGRYALLTSLAQGLHALHQAGATCEGLHPDQLVVADSGQLRLTDLGLLLPLPVPPGAPIRVNLYTPPELVLTPAEVNARADMYSFGAILYSLEYLGHALEEKDFEKQFSPKLITDRYPDVHPGFNRLILKTFTRDLHSRFPTDEVARKDPGGFTELIRSLEVAGRTYDNPRLDIAAWTTTGMVRTGNEDAFSLLHAVDARQDDLWEYVLILLADGMGGYEAGEVAASLALAELKKFILAQPIFGALTGQPASAPLDIEKCKQTVEQALRHANKEVHTFSRTPGKGKRGMGCTAEVVYIDNRNIVVGHVGDSRTYHIHKGRLIQLTRDQTWVQRMVELGQLTAEEAEHHDRKNELQQAIGGQPEVRPGVYAATLQRNDWVLVCSDGLTNHINNRELEQMMTRETANSAEEAARRFLNLVNLRGATDNTTVVAVRAS